MAFHEQVDSLALDCAAGILCNEGANSFQINNTSQRNHFRINGDGTVYTGAVAAACNPVAFAAA